MGEARIVTSPFALNRFVERWKANEERLRRNHEYEARSVGQDEEAAEELKQASRERYAMVREIVIRLSKESVTGAGQRDLQIYDLITASQVIARSEGIETEGF